MCSDAVIRWLAREEKGGKPLDFAVQVECDAAAFPAADHGDRVRAGVQLGGQEAGRPSTFGEILQTRGSPARIGQPRQEAITAEDAGRRDTKDRVGCGPVNTGRLLAGRAEQAPYEGDGDA